ncbi:unnamed protein product [Oikopleura dioica]|uniref:Uncharacterized protein n=1 Tax=Oikopleura dioica TaxID=34765 RepID=E4YBC0_OIKDI|nr:unnamed protein product [Oikopleura dioica]
MIRVFGRFSALRRNLAASVSRRHDELRHTWYAVLGVKESASHQEIEEAFYEKLTNTEINLNAQNEKEVDDILDQNMIIMVTVTRKIYFFDKMLFSSFCHQIERRVQKPFPS